MTTGYRLIAVAAFAIIIASGCSRDEGLRCESTERYGSSVSTPPLRVPDDLSVPDETDMLRIPEASTVPGEESAEALPCLESPPDFFNGANSADNG